MVINLTIKFGPKTTIEVFFKKKNNLMWFTLAMALTFYLSAFIIELPIAINYYRITPDGNFPWLGTTAAFDLIILGFLTQLLWIFIVLWKIGILKMMLKPFEPIQYY